MYLQITFLYLQGGFFVLFLIAFDLHLRKAKKIWNG
jgi:hypothetical protein